MTTSPGKILSPVRTRASRLMSVNEDGSSSEDEVFVVEAILDRKKRGHKFYYLLKWEGYSETTWEPEENIIDKEMLKSFLDSNKYIEMKCIPESSKPQCDVCDRRGGSLYQCSQCIIVRHRYCFENGMPSGAQFLCNDCLSDSEKCFGCRGSTAPKGQLLRCRICRRSFHRTCAINFDSPDQACFECSHYPTKVQQILTFRSSARNDSHIEDEFLVKFETWSYRKVAWVPYSWLNVVSSVRLRYFLKAPVNILPQDAIMEDWVHVEKVMYIKESEVSPTKYLVKWKGLSADQATWEDENSAGDCRFPEMFDISKSELDAALKRYRKSLKIYRDWHVVDPVKHKLKFTDLRKEDIPLGVNLMEYQLEGVNWILYKWQKNLNCLLADEMGLGKTIQTIAVIEYLRRTFSVYPILIVAPSTVCENWISELNRCCPKVYHTLYGGNHDSRSRLVEYELFNDQLALSRHRGQKLIKNHVVITSFQILTRDSSILKSIPWQMVIVDEAHRLKGTGNLLSRSLEGFKPSFRLLLTGTPLQNNLTELFHIMSFLDPDNFSDIESLEEKFSDLSDDQSKVAELHELFRPRILRRTKKDVGLDVMVPPKREIMVPVSMTSPQLAIYKSVIEKNYKFLVNLGKPGAPRASLTNLWMELRKAVNHGYLIVEEKPAKDLGGTIKQLLEMSGKLELLDKMLHMLQSQGHRVLIFSQMTKMLDM